MTKVNKALAVIGLVAGVSFGMWLKSHSGERPERKSSLVDAVVECQHKIKLSVNYAMKFDNAFKYKGTRKLHTDRYQVAGNVLVGKGKKAYGCLVNYKSGNYEIEVIL